MASLRLHPKSNTPVDVSPKNPLPQLLQTPTGLALLELQGTINLPDTDHADPQGGTPIGRLVFPLYDHNDPGSTAWMKRVYMYVGKHQRLTGEVKKLPKAIAVIRKRGEGGAGEQAEQPDLEIAEIVKHKIIFSSRPEPVGTSEVAT